MVETFGLCTPRKLMHWCTASIMTATPRGASASSMAPTIWEVMVSCVCKRLAKMSTTRASLEMPTTFWPGR